jgi:hypothetical protein
LTAQISIFEQGGIRKQAQQKAKCAVLDFYKEARKTYIRQAREKLIEYALEHPGEAITADVIHIIAPPPTFQKDGIDSRIVGSVLKCDSFQCIGTRKSIRSECHHRTIGLFRLKA